MLPTTYSFILLPFIHIHSFPSRQIPSHYPEASATPAPDDGQAPRPTRPARVRFPTSSPEIERKRPSGGRGSPSCDPALLVIPTPELAPNAAVLELEGSGGRPWQSGAWQAVGSRKFSGKWDAHFKVFAFLAFLFQRGPDLRFRTLASSVGHSTVTARTATRTRGPQYPRL